RSGGAENARRRGSTATCGTRPPSPPPTARRSSLEMFAYITYSHIMGTEDFASLADAAMAGARAAGASRTSVRLHRVRAGRAVTPDAQVVGSWERTDVGLAVAVPKRGAPGFAPSTTLSRTAAAAAARSAAELADLSDALVTDPLEPADEPSYPDGEWTSPV